MLKKAALLIAFVFAVSFLAFSQSQSQTSQDDASKKLEFDVATVKPSPPNEQGGGIKPMPGGQTYVATGVPTKLMIQLMFHLTPNQVVGGPDWLNNDAYDVDAKADRPRTIDELHIMFQNLLVDRFKLQYRMEQREMSSYALQVDKTGSKMTANTGPETFDIPYRGTGIGKLQFTHCSMYYFSWFLSNFPAVGRPVVDQTKLPGFYDFTLAFTPELPPNAPPDIVERVQKETNGLDIFTAMKQELGLKLESGKFPVPVMVIESAQKPTADN